MMSLNIITQLRRHNIKTVADEKVRPSQGLNREEWKTTQDLALVNEATEEWLVLINTLKSSFISLNDNKPDKLVWTKNISTGVFSVKLGYEAQATKSFTEEK